MEQHQIQSSREQDTQIHLERLDDQNQAAVAQVNLMNDLLHNMLDQIGSLCNEIGHTDGKGGSQKADNNSNPVGAQAPKGDDPVENAIKNHEVFKALILMLFTGSNSDYNYLAHGLNNLNDILKKLEAEGGNVKSIQDAIKALMDGKGDPAAIAAAQQTLYNFSQGKDDQGNPLPPNEKNINPDLLKEIGQFAKPGGDLDQLVSSATNGTFHSFKELEGKGPVDPKTGKPQTSISQDHGLHQVEEALTGVGGDSASKQATQVFNDLSNAMGALNTQNQAQVQQMSLLNKQIDSDSKLLTSALSTFKSMLQAVTVFSGT